MMGTIEGIDTKEIVKMVREKESLDRAIHRITGSKAWMIAKPTCPECGVVQKFLACRKDNRVVVEEGHNWNCSRKDRNGKKTVIDIPIGFTYEVEE
jgi:carbamoylphosphate synthase small subunit